MPASLSDTELALLCSTSAVSVLLMSQFLAAGCSESVAGGLVLIAALAIFCRQQARRLLHLVLVRPLRPLPGDPNAVDQQCSRWRVARPSPACSCYLSPHSPYLAIYDSKCLSSTHRYHRAFKWVHSLHSCLVIAKVIYTLQMKVQPISRAACAVEYALTMKDLWLFWMAPKFRLLPFMCRFAQCPIAASQCAFLERQQRLV